MRRRRRKRCPKRHCKRRQSQLKNPPTTREVEAEVVAEDKVADVDKAEENGSPTRTPKEEVVKAEEVEDPNQTWIAITVANTGTTRVSAGPRRRQREMPTMQKPKRRLKT